MPNKEKEHFCKHCDSVVTNKKTPLRKEDWKHNGVVYEYFVCTACGFRYTPEELK